MTIAPDHRLHTAAASSPTIQIKQRTDRSFETPRPELLCIWLKNQDFYAVPRSANHAEFARLAWGKDTHRQLVIVYKSGSVVCGGEDMSGAAARLAAICETAPRETIPTIASLFDHLESEVTNGTR